jgi:hypothetical protein
MNPHTKERKKEVVKLIKQARKWVLLLKFIIKMPQPQQHPPTSS